VEVESGTVSESLEESEQAVIEASRNKAALVTVLERLTYVAFIMSKVRRERQNRPRRLEIYPVTCILRGLAPC
jgi:hypothetical protein